MQVSIQVPAGGLIALVGPVGSGKSTLVSALLAELEMASGSVRVPSGRVGYVPQQAWIFNASLRENVVVGSVLDRKRYENALDVSGLVADIQALPAGDLTEIGERGINLSGGQKQRVCIARAVYSGAAFFVLDDPLSAVDAHVAQHIFTKCINGAMAARHSFSKVLCLVTLLTPSGDSDYPFTFYSQVLSLVTFYSSLVNTVL
jgi:ABC-type multidrug transport system fused ATPase/permease subunit